MRNLVVTMISLVLALSRSAWAQESLLLAEPALATEEQLVELSEQALDRLVKGEVEGFELLKKHAADTGGGEALDRYFRSQADKVKTFVRRFGKPLARELVARDRVGDSFCRLVYLCKYEKSFLRWTLVYYRPKDAWVFLRVDFDDDVDALFRDAARGAAAGKPDQDGAAGRSGGTHAAGKPAG